MKNNFNHYNAEKSLPNSKWTNVISQNQLRAGLMSNRRAIGMSTWVGCRVFCSAQLTLCAYVCACACAMLFFVMVCFGVAASLPCLVPLWAYTKCRINCDWVLFPFHDHCTVTLHQLKQMYRAKWYEWIGSMNKSKMEIVFMLLNWRMFSVINRDCNDL